MDVHDQHTDEPLGEVAYTRGLTNHPLEDLPEVTAITTACRETGVLMSPSNTSSSNHDGSEDGDDEGSCHGFASSSNTPDHYDNIEDDPMYAVLLHTIRQQNNLRQCRRSSTRDDLLDTDEEPAPQQVQAGVLPIAPAAPPQSATPVETPPRRYNLRSRNTARGTPQKKGGHNGERR